MTYGERKIPFAIDCTSSWKDRLRIEILIAFRDYGFVDHVVELIPPSQLLRVNVTR